MNCHSFFLAILMTLFISSCGKDDEVDATPSSTGPGIEVETLPINGTYRGDDGISIDSKGALYVSHLASGVGEVIYKVSSDLNATAFATNLPGPMGHFIDAADNLFVAFRNSNTIAKITPDGNMSSYVQDARFKGGSLVVDDDGTIYHSVFSSNAVFKISPDKEVQRLASGSSLNVPFGITLGPDKNIYVANFGDGVINKISQDGSVTKLATLPSKIGYLIFANERLYATGFSSNIIYTIELNGAVNEYIGTGTNGDDDGVDETVTFSAPNGLIATADGKAIYVSQKNFRIRKITVK